MVQPNTFSPFVSGPLPELPVELVRAILQQCGPTELAVTSRVSLAWLELSSALLHDQIDIELGEQTSRLFCGRDPAQDQPQLHPYHDLIRIRSLTIRTGPHYTPPLKQPSTSRLVHGSAPLAVNLLILHPFGDVPSEAARWKHVLPLLAPSTLHMEGLPHGDDKPNNGPLMDFNSLSGWYPSLTQIVSTNVEHWRSTLAECSFIPEGVTEPPLVMVFDLSTAQSEHELGAEDRIAILRGNLVEAVKRCRDGGRGRIEHAVVKVASTEVMEQLREWFLIPWFGGTWAEDEAWWDEQVQKGKIRFDIT